MTTPKAPDYYRTRIQFHEQRVAELEKTSWVISLVRLALFVSAGASGAASIWGSNAASSYVCGASIVAFIVMVIVHERVVSRSDDAKEALKYTQDGLKRSAFAEGIAAAETKPPATDSPTTSIKPAAVVVPKEHAYAGDLDLIGDRSLHERLDTMGTAGARQKLADWLLSPSPLSTVRERQIAIRELSQQHELREELHVRARIARKQNRPLDRFLGWCESSQPSSINIALIALAWVLPIISLTAIVYAAINRLPLTYWLAPVGIEYLVTFIVARRLEQAILDASTGLLSLGTRVSSFALVLNAPWQASLLKKEQQTLRTGQVDAPTALAQLRRLADISESRENWMIRTLISPILLLDVHLLWHFERWRLRFGPSVRGWLESMAEVEALSCAATYAYEHPNDAFAELVDGPATLEAEQVAHPLLNPAKRVANDVLFAGPGTALLITGSNMSGKSTLMRSLGLAVVMARAGLPVCARALKVSALSVHTSMRVSDSVDAGVSHFYAELLALRRVVDAANTGAQVFFLLDEILHGTNSRERHLGARGVVKHLLSQQAMGAVSTHDLALIDLVDEAKGSVRAVHLMEQAEGDRMVFDYKLRDGVLTSGNALRLMKSLGLPIE